ncbi:hypothetical protein KDX14_27780 [Burkholderia cenocepacia]|uniref:hypothetical protein n=1 Tax=Burkholderia cepacia complex TaxID=87882 RepID=UPI000F5B63E3|nr:MULTISPECIES: hypothetical protein [Burkholderia cepacia complex]MBR8073331.1 hypothetical protein [Burkholderia cenocepacia]RQS79750.1 hypothetical protein DF032_14355 [Burkholderia seminalis]
MNKKTRSGVLSKTDHKSKARVPVKGAASMSGPEKLLSVSKPARGAARGTTSSRVKHRKTMY